MAKKMLEPLPVPPPTGIEHICGLERRIRNAMMLPQKAKPANPRKEDIIFPVECGEDRISFDEFKRFMIELVQNKKGALPDLNDWKEIKKQMDRVNTAIDVDRRIERVTQVDGSCEKESCLSNVKLKYDQERLV